MRTVLNRLCFLLFPLRAAAPRARRAALAVARPLPRPPYRTRRVTPRDIVVAGALCFGASATWAAPDAAVPASAAGGIHGVSTECRGVGDIVEKIALWRDAGGAAQSARAEIARRIADPDARAVAVSLVGQLYTGFARQMTPAQARQAYTASCALAQENATRATAPAPASSGGVAADPTSAGAP